MPETYKLGDANFLKTVANKNHLTSAQFAKLPEEEQQRMITQHKADEAAKGKNSPTSVPKNIGGPASETPKKENVGNINMNAIPTMRTEGTGGTDYRNVYDQRPHSAASSSDSVYNPDDPNGEGHDGWKPVTDEERDKIDAKRDAQHEAVVAQAKEGLKDVPGALTEANGYGGKGEEEPKEDPYKEIKGDSGGGNNPSDPKSKRAYSIWDAYQKGMLDKGGATYYTIDAISNYLKNLGRGFGNIGAQFTGGTIDNNESQSQWENKMHELNAEETQMDKERMGGAATRKALSEILANEGSAIANNNGRLTVNAKNAVKRIADKLDDNNPAKYLLLSAAATGDIGGLNAFLAAGANAFGGK